MSNFISKVRELFSGDKLIKSSEAAELLGLHEQSIRRWRMEGKGPGFIKLDSGGVRYRLRDVLDYLEKHQVDHSEA